MDGEEEVKLRSLVTMFPPRGESQAVGREGNEEEVGSQGDEQGDRDWSIAPAVPGSDHIPLSWDTPVFLSSIFLFLLNIGQVGFRHFQPNHFLGRRENRNESKK